MSVAHFGDFDTTETVNIPFNTFSSDDPSASVTITNLVAADVKLHKDGSLTQRSSAAGVTVSIDYDGITGNHLVEIDLSDNTDTGFYSAGSRYQIRMEGTTVDGGTINAWIGSFSIGCILRPSVSGRKIIVDANSRIDIGSWLGAVVTLSSGNKPDVNVNEISDDNIAANNLELACDNYSITRGLTGTAVPSVAAGGAGGLPTDSVGKTLFNDLSASEINTEVDTALSDIGLDHLISVPDADTPVDDSIIAKLAASSGDWSDFVASLHSLKAISESVGNISIGTAAINKVAESFTKVGAEPETNTYTSTHEEDGTHHIVEDDGGTTDAYYQFDIGGNGVPVEFNWVGYCQSNNDSYAIYAYNWGTTSWEQVGTANGTSGTTIQNLSFAMTTSHVGAGANLGKVRMRFFSTDGTTFATDRLLCSYAVVSQSVGYSDGAIWVDTNGSNTNVEPYVDGTADNPVSTWAAALTLSSTLGLKRFHIINGSSITLTGNSDNYTLNGDNWTILLNNQSIAGAYFHGANASGLSSGSGYEFHKCTIADGALMEVEAGLFFECALASDETNKLVLSSAGTYYFDQCFSGVAGTDTPTIDFNTAGDCNLNVRHYSGGVKIFRMNDTGSDKMSLEGHGQLKLDSSCVGGEIAIRGHFDVTDETGGAVSFSRDANFFSTVLHDGVAQAGGNNTITLSSSASSMDGSYDPSEVLITSGTGAGQTRLVYEYDGTSKIAVVDRNWKINPDDTSHYRISANPGREHVNEGLAQAGTSSSITLNALASSSDEAYTNQIIFLRSGTGEDQVKVITAYDGTTKVATVHSNWATNPDATTGYAVLPGWSDPVTILGTYSDTQDISTRIPASLSGGRMDSDIQAINGVNAEAITLQRALSGTIWGSAVTGTLTQSAMTTDLSEVTDDHYQYRLLTWISGVLAGQSREIEGYIGSSKTLQYSQTTGSDVPANGDLFIIT